MKIRGKYRGKIAIGDVEDDDEEAHVFVLDPKERTFWLEKIEHSLSLCKQLAIIHNICNKSVFFFFNK